MIEVLRKRLGQEVVHNLLCTLDPMFAKRLEETVISLKGLPYSLHCSYSDFTMLNRDVFPQRINLYTEGTGKKYSLDMKLSRIGTDSNWDTNTELSSKYKKISLPELLKIVEQLK